MGGFDSGADVDFAVMQNSDWLCAAQKLDSLSWRPSAQQHDCYWVNWRFLNFTDRLLNPTEPGSQQDCQMSPSVIVTRCSSIQGDSELSPTLTVSALQSLSTNLTSCPQLSQSMPSTNQIMCRRNAAARTLLRVGRADHQAKHGRGPLEYEVGRLNFLDSASPV